MPAAIGEVVRTTIIPGQSLRQMIRTEIEDQAASGGDKPDPREIAVAIWNDVPQDTMHEIMLTALVAVINAEQRKMRAEAVQSAEVAARSKLDENGLTPAQAARVEDLEVSKQNLAEEKAVVAERRANKFFNSWVSTATGNKFLGDCTSEDFRFSSSAKKKQSESLLDSAARDEKFAKHLEKTGYTTLREMGYVDAVKALAESK